MPISLPPYALHAPNVPIFVFKLLEHDLSSSRKKTFMRTNTGQENLCHSTWRRGHLRRRPNINGNTMQITRKNIGTASTHTSKYPVNMNINIFGSKKLPGVDTDQSGRQRAYHSRSRLGLTLTLTLLTWRIWWAPNNVSKLQMGFNSAFKGLIFWVRSN